MNIDEKLEFVNEFKGLKRQALCFQIAMTLKFADEKKGEGIEGGTLIKEGVIYYKKNMLLHYIKGAHPSNISHATSVMIENGFLDVAIYDEKNDKFLEGVKATNYEVGYRLTEKGKIIF
ncbi:hypothetical protein N9R79_11930 [Vibrio sp.]|nr:hypothetical protein [Vibrio sp.]